MDSAVRAARWVLGLCIAVALAGASEATPPEIVSGEFRFHRLQGWSFEDQAVIPEVRRKEDADLWFESGQSRDPTLVAAGGLLPLADVVGADELAPSPVHLFEALLAADPSALELKERAWPDRRTSETDVLVLRTRRGGWARIVIVERLRTRHGLSDTHNWPLVVRYTYNPREPRFAPTRPDAKWVGGFELAPAATPRGWVTPATGDGGGRIPDDAESAEVLRALARRSAAPDAAYSFTRAGRDAGWQDAAAPPPDLVYGEIGDSMTVRRGGRDGSTIDDLGVADWGETPILVGSPWAGTPTAVASLGHVYRVMLADGLDPVPVLLRVTGLEPGARVAFRWVALRGGALSTSRDLRIDPSLAASLTAELAAVARTYRGGFAGDVPAPGSELRAAWEALSQQCAISLTRIRLADLSPGFPRGIELQFDAAIQRLDPQPIVLFESRVQPTAKRVQGEVLAGGSAVATPRIAVSWLRALDTVTRQAGATWSLLAPGVIRIAPLPGAR